MLKDELPDDLVAFLKTDRRLEYDASMCEIGVFALRSLDEIQEIELAVSAERGGSTCLMRGLDLLKSCEEYDPRGMLVYIPSLRKYGSYDGEKQSLVTYRSMSWSDFLANPVRYINAAWFEDKEIAEETFDERGADRIFEASSAANASEAGFLCSVLEHAGIRATTTGELLQTFAGWLPMGEATAPRVWVREGDLRRAREIVNDVSDRRRAAGRFPARDDDDIAFPCQECGVRITFPATSRGHVEICPACGNYVDVPESGRISLPIDASDVGSAVDNDGPPKFFPSARKPAADTPMSSEQQTASRKLSSAETRCASPRTTRQLWLEVIAILFLAYIPSIVPALADVLVWRSPRGQSPWLYHYVLLIVQSLEISLPLLVILALSGEPWKAFGIVRPNWIIDILLAFVVTVVASSAYRLVIALLPTSYLHSLLDAHSVHRAAATGVFGVLMLVVGQACVGFSEEFVNRAYFITRFERLFSSTWLAVVVSTALFASCHMYQGVLGTISAATMGLVFAIAYCWTRRLWPLCVAHAAHNIWIGLG
jgi:membrane protease YdiL (CAAX protease family)